MWRFVPELDRDLVVEAARHTHAFWAAHRSLEEHTARTLRQLELAGPEILHYAGLVDDTGLVASMKRYGVLLAAPDGRVTPAVGVGAVFTRPDARRRGAAAALIREILRQARALGAGAAWLHSEIDPAYYARLGFLALPAGAHRARAADLPERGALSIRRSEPGDVDRMLAWYDAGFGAAGAKAPWLRPKRDAARWRYFCFRNQVETWILEDAGRDAGYLAASGDAADGALHVDEWSAPGVPRERVWATLRVFAEREGLAEVAGWLRPDHAGPPFRDTPRPHGAVPMIALLDGAWSAAPLDPERTFFGSFDYF